MKKYRLETTLLSFVFIIGAANVAQPPVLSPQGINTNSSLSDEDETQFYQNLQDGIKKTQDQYNKLKANVDSKKGNATDKERQALMNSATALEVKYTLYKNFYNTPSVKNSPQVRSDLQKVFNKDFVTLEDLTQLKKTVTAEKEKNRSEQGSIQINGLK